RSWVGWIATKSTTAQALFGQRVGEPRELADRQRLGTASAVKAGDCQDRSRAGLCRTRIRHLSDSCRDTTQSEQGVGERFSTPGEDRMHDALEDRFVADRGVRRMETQTDEGRVHLWRRPERARWKDQQSFDGRAMLDEEG